MEEAEKRSHYILVADDYSSEALIAANTAIQIARHQNQSIRGLYVIDEVLALDTYTNYHEELPALSILSNADSREPTSRAELMSLFETQGELALHRLETAGADAEVPVTTKLLVGGVSELVLREAARVQLLAIGRRGHRHKDDLTSLGHNFRKIAHHVHVPMLVGGSISPSLHRILLAYNGQAHADEALAWTARLQQALSAEVIVLSVREDTGFHQGGVNLEEIKDRLSRSGLNGYRFMIGHGRPSVEMAAIAAANNVDLIILGRYRHQALVEWLVGSTVDRLLRETPLPVFIV